MSQVEYQYFENLKVYHKDSDRFDYMPDGNPPVTNMIGVSLNDFHKATFDLGNYNGNVIDAESRKFYESLVDFMIEEKDGTYYKRLDFENSETSIISSLNFFMGMIAAKIVAEKQYNVSKLYHLTDTNAYAHKIIINNGQELKKHPDFIGVNNSNEPIIVEAKGKSKYKFSTKITCEANKQLKSIYKIDDVSNGIRKHSYFSYQIKKHIIGSTFYNNGKRLTFHDIDPNDIGEEILQVDFNKLAYDYYRNYMLILLSYPTTLDYNLNIIKAEFDDYIVGLNKKIYDELESYRTYYKSVTNLENLDIDSKLEEKINGYIEGLRTEGCYYSDGVYFEYKGIK